MKNLLGSLFALFFPRYCAVCGTTITRTETLLCTRCDLHMPRTNYHLQPDNNLEKHLWGRLTPERATAWFFYSKGSPYTNLLHQLKYEDQREMGRLMGRRLATEILASGFFTGIDLLIPVPLHPKRMRQRGYNQSEWIARGIADITGIAIDNALLVRQVNTETQTRKTRFGRSVSMEGVFAPAPHYTCQATHVLLIDDVITTGATIIACAEALLKANSVKVSVLAVGATV